MSPEGIGRPGSLGRAWIEVDLGALTHNARVIRRATPTRARVGILVKANGYGHGMEMAARCALAGGADQLIVATLDEAVTLREAGLDAPLLVAYPIAAEALGLAATAGIEVSVGGASGAQQMAAAWRRHADELGATELLVHVEIDTGMGRGGVAPTEAAAVLELLAALPNVRVRGIWSHLARGNDPVAAAQQAALLDEVLAGLSFGDGPRPPVHLVASEGLFCATAPVHDMVRIGLAYYGELGVDVEPAPALAALASDLRPAMRIMAHPVRLEWVDAGASIGYGGEWRAPRRSLIATLPVGYADGWARAYWPGSDALGRGRRLPLVGRVSMDSVCADVTDLAVEGEPGLDEEFVLLGAQAGERVTVAELARRRGTIANEVLTSFGNRLAHRYVGTMAGPGADE